VRDQLHSSAIALARFGLLDETRIRSVKTQPGYRAMAEDVVTLVAVFKDNWTAAQGRTAVEESSLGQWRTQAFELVEALGLRDGAPLTVGEVAAVRQKAFTLLVRTYEDARGAVGYLRARQGDAAAIAPSLYAGRGGGRRGAREEASPPFAGVAATVAATEDRPIVIENPLGLPLTHPFSS
jgi:hypothetical protein